MAQFLFDIQNIKSIERHVCEAEIRSLCRSQYLGDHEVICRSLGRYLMYLDTRDVGFAQHIIMDGYWEYWVTQFMIETVKPGFHVLDIGANFGYYTNLLSDLVGHEGYCLAVEPNPRTVAKLKKTISVNGFFSRCRVIDKALGKEQRTRVPLYASVSEPKNSCVVSPGYVATAPDVEIIEVEGSTVDITCANEPRIDFVKIDAEGSEFDILLGMSNVLETFRPKLLLEFNAHRNYDAAQLLDYMSEFYNPPKALGYNARLKKVDKKELLRLERLDDWMLYFE